MAASAMLSSGAGVTIKFSDRPVADAARSRSSTWTGSHHERLARRQGGAAELLGDLVRAVP